MRLHLWAEAGANQVILHCAGDIVYQREANLFLGVVNTVRLKRTIIDLRQVRTIDAYGLGKILQVYKQLWDDNCEIIFLNPSKHVRELFRLTRLEFCLERHPEKRFQVQDGRNTIPHRFEAWHWSKAS
jgi:anti-anti-sigma factor